MIKMIDSNDVAAGLIGTLIVILSFLLAIALVIGCAYIIEWLIGLLNITIDHTMYWTGVVLIILFSAFCKSSSKKE